MVYVFYADRLYADYPSLGLASRALQDSSEIYNGGYLYDVRAHPSGHWFRPDMTPALLEEVPKTLQTLLLLLL